MSWRTLLAGSVEELGIIIKDPLHAKIDHISDIADSAYSAEGDSKFLEALSHITAQLPITPLEIKESLDPEEIQQWHQGVLSNKELDAFTRSLVQCRAMMRGEISEHFVHRATCKQCGPIWLWMEGEFLGCPWCINRINQHPIPRPTLIRCGDCDHFYSIEHPFLGHCQRGEVEDIAGLWRTTPRECERFVPIP